MLKLFQAGAVDTSSRPRAVARLITYLGRVALHERGFQVSDEGVAQHHLRLLFAGKRPNPKPQRMQEAVQTQAYRGGGCK